MTFTIKIRGAPGGTIQHEYLCPVHGRFTIEVPRDDVPDEVFCPTPIEVFDAGFPGRRIVANRCGRSSPWSPSGITCRVPLASFNRGKADAPPTKNALTTRDLAEGMPMNEWRAKRAKLRQDERRRKIKDLLR